MEDQGYSRRTLAGTWRERAPHAAGDLRPDLTDVPARPDRTTVLVTGDGGGAMALADLVTFVTEAGSAVVVVFNDAAYGAELHQYGAKGVDRGGMELPEVDFAALGRALGAEGQKITRLAELDVVRQWVAAGARGALVVDITVTRTVAADFITGH